MDFPKDVWWKQAPKTKDLPSNIPGVQHLYIWQESQLKICIFKLMTVMVYFHSNSVTPSKKKCYHPSSTSHTVPSPYMRLLTKNTPSSHLLTLHCFNRLLGNPPHTKFLSDMFKALTTSFSHDLCTPGPSHASSVTTPTLAVLSRVHGSLKTFNGCLCPRDREHQFFALHVPQTSTGQQPCATHHPRQKSKTERVRQGPSRRPR